jgi:imidazolonepropionase-like amidohydrolase
MENYGDSKKGHSLLITNARIIDGKGSVFDGLKSIRIEKGDITSIEDLIPPIEGEDLLDVKGATVIPGIIDAHTHLASVPGSLFRKDSQEELVRLRHHHLRSRIACGNTSILDCSISPTLLKWHKDYYDAGGKGPRIFALAPTFYIPGGYCDDADAAPYMMAESMRSVANREDVISVFEDYEDLKDMIVGVKVPIETGMGMLPVHSPELLKIINDECEKRNQPIYVHAMRNREQELGLTMNIHTLVHTGYMKGTPTTDYMKRLKKQGIYQTTTLSFMEMAFIQEKHPNGYDTLVELTVPSTELASDTDSKAWKLAYLSGARMYMPDWMPESIVSAYAGFMTWISPILGKVIMRAMDNACKAVKKMYDADIPIVMGSDSGNWPMVPACFHGPSTIREIEILGKVGMKPMDVILSSTSIPAKMMGADHLIGTVEVGKKADLLVLDEDPLEDLGAFRNSMHYVILAGEARTPKEWMQN